TPKDTTPVNWLITVKDINIQDVRYSMSMGSDTIFLSTCVDKAVVRGVSADIGRMSYNVQSAFINGSIDALQPVQDVEFLALPWQINVRGQFLYYDTLNIKGSIAEARFKCANLWEIKDLKAEVEIDEQRVNVQELAIELPKSFIGGAVSVPMRKWMPDSVGNVSLFLFGELYPEEAAFILPKSLSIPSNPIKLRIDAAGDIDKRIRLDGKIDAEEVASVLIKGSGVYLLNENTRNANVKVEVETKPQLMEYLEKMGLTNERWTIPSGVSLLADAIYHRNNIDLKASLQTPRGSLEATGIYGLKSERFELETRTNRLSVQQFLPKDTIGDLQAYIKVAGQGTDPFSPKTFASLELSLDTLTYNHKSLGNIVMVSQLEKQQLFAALSSESEGMKMMGQLDARLAKEDIDASLRLEVDTIVPSLIGLGSGPVLGSTFKLLAAVRTDTKQRYDVEGKIVDCVIETDKKIIRPTNLDLTAHSSSEHLMAKINSGDLVLSFSSKNGLTDFVNRLKRVSNEVSLFTTDTTNNYSISHWIEHYPDANFSVSLGRNNPIRSYLDEHRYGWKRANLDIRTSSQSGLSGEFYLNGFQKDTFRIDEMDLTVFQDTTMFYAVGAVHKQKFRNQDPFEAFVNLTTNMKHAELFANLKDKESKDLLLLGVRAQWNREDITFSLTPDPPVLVYNKFLSDGKSYVKVPLLPNKNIDAHLFLKASDDPESKIMLDTKDIKGEYLMSALIQKFDLKRIQNLGVVPNMDGILNADLRWVKTAEGNKYIAQASLDRFHFQKNRVGDIALTGFYEPVEKGSYAALDVHLDGANAITGEAFISKNKGVDPVWRLVVNKLPLSKANPFLPDDLVSLAGNLNAELSNTSKRGDIKQLKPTVMQGYISIKEGSVYSAALNNKYGIDPKPIRIENDKIRFDRFKIEALNNTALTLNGSIGLTDDNELKLNLRGNDVLLVDSKRTQQTLLYGRLGISTDISLSGPASTMKVKGALSINGNTNLTYILKDSKLSKRNRFDGLIEFTEFGDTLFTTKKANMDTISLGGLDVTLALHVDPAVSLGAEITADGSNAVQVQGGGDLNFRYPPYGQMSLSGTYNFNDGFIAINQPPILSKKFKVERGNYVSWSGDVMNPFINFKATERVSSVVALPGETKRKVNFDVSVVAKNRVNDLSLLFTLDAPEDLTLRNNIAAMTDEEKSRQALMLLSLGTYLGSTQAGTSGFDVNSTLMSLVTKEFNALVGDLINADINLGIEQDAEGKRGTNYSYSIAKKFYNDRITFQIGGQVETTNPNKSSNQSFIDNISLDYRLDQAGTHYLRLFHKKDYENILDGEVIETGAGYVLRKRLYRLRDLFNFKVKPTLPKTQEESVTPTPKATEESKDEKK
ncbi:MAG: translocation/assembly module TamB domain-containing protein, partial [Porphyromonas sp.]|nr:translocation/assembly module TamB domain-containing protein [Porphyromonas sp.]